MRNFLTGASIPFLLLFLLPCILPSMATAAENFTELDNACSNKSGSVNPDDSITACNELIQSRRITHEALSIDYSNRGWAHQRKSDYALAIADMTKATELDPRNAIAWANFGAAYFALADYRNAIEKYTKMISLNPSPKAYQQINPYRFRGLSYLRLNDFDHALSDFNSAVLLLPKDSYSYLNRAQAHRAKGDPDEDMTDLDQAVNLDPHNLDALHSRAEAYDRLKQYQNEIADGAAAVRINANDAPGWNSQCWGRAIVGYLDEALHDCNEALRLGPNYADAYDSRGVVNLKHGSLDDAIADYDSALKIKPKLASSLCGRGLAKNKKQAGSGDGDIAAAIAIDPTIAKQYSEYGIK